MGVRVARDRAFPLLVIVWKAGHTCTHKMREFYRGVLQPPGLVFDIGANVGVLSAVFASLGARVVASEPNADCVRHLQLSYASKRIEVIQAAIGAKNGLAVLNVSNERST